jgi:hypothetical protein
MIPVPVVFPSPFARMSRLDGFVSFHILWRVLSHCMSDRRHHVWGLCPKSSRPSTTLTKLASHRYVQKSTTLQKSRSVHFGSTFPAWKSESTVKKKKKLFVF